MIKTFLKRPLRCWLWLQGMLLLAGCVSPPPSDSSNLCSIFEERRAWYKAARKSEKRWGVPIAVNMAFIMQESAYRGRAKPPRRYYFGFIPGPRPSNAFGFAQALDSTWSEYKDKAGNWGARRSSFNDAIDFVGWYNAGSNRMSGIARNDAYNLYLAYHEGNGGFQSRSYRGNETLLTTANRVRNNAERYQAQLNSCERELNRSWLMRLLF